MDIMKLAQPIRVRPARAYALALAVTCVTIGARLLFSDVLQGFPSVLPVTAVTLAAFFGGRGPAILAAVLSQLFVQYYVLPPLHSFALEWPSGYVGVAFYAMLCAIIIVLMDRIFYAHTALQASERHLQIVNEGLEQRVAARTADLLTARDALRVVNRDLETLVEARVGELKVANEEIQRFAYIVSHDLRAPLVNILGFTSELEALRAGLGAFLADAEKAAPGIVSEDRRQMIETELPEALAFIRSSSAKMDRLINAILKLSREGRRELRPEPIDLAALVEAQRATLIQQLATHDAELMVEGSLPPLVSDKLAVEQILGNLLENAVKYLSPARPGRITVGATAEGRRLRIAIADNGRGIDERDFGRIFDLFRRSGEQDTRGEGIGLAYVRNLVRRLGGEVEVASELGRGSTFTVNLPASLEPAVAEPAI